jgi:uncharacterized protein (TIGR03118 family)
VNTSSKFNLAIKPIGAFAIAALLLPHSAFCQHYTQTNLIADSAATVNGDTNGVTIDPKLSNPWGLSRGATTPWWINDNGTGFSELYSVNNTPPLAATVVARLPFVTIPPPVNGAPPSAPSGIVFAGEANFEVESGETANFIFVTEDGTISDWKAGTTATLKVDNSRRHAVYKGCTIAKHGGEYFLYVTNFNSGDVEVYNTSFERVETGEEHFKDAFVPFGFAPYNVENIGGNLFVTYAAQDTAKHDPVGGQGNGYVNVFSSSGKLLSHLQHGPWFDSPWGITLTPRDFGAFSNSILVGNFGSDADPAGEISAFNPVDGRFLGHLLNADGSRISIPNLWALEFGNSAGASGPSNTLFFTAGPNAETNGLFGTLTPVASEANDLEQ